MMKNNQIEIGYVETEIGWIPIDWKEYRIENISEFVTKGSTPTTYGFEWEDEGIYFFKSDCVSIAGFVMGDYKYISSKAHDSMARSKIKGGDILITITGNIGKVCIVPPNIEEANINQHIARIRISSQDIYSQFVYYYLAQAVVREYFEKIKTGLAYPQISLAQVRAFTLYAPRLSEQKIICKILSLVDDKLEYLGKKIENLIQLKKALAKKLLTEGIGHTEFKDSEVGRIPKEWGVKKLNEIVTIISGGTPKTSVSEYWDNGDIDWATPTDITANDSIYISTTEKRITDKGLKESSANLLPVGSLLMTSRATIGAVCICTKPMATNQGFKSMICTDKVQNLFMYYYIDKLKDKFIELSSGSTFLEISKSVIENVLITVPPIEEQNSIVNVLFALDKAIQQYKNQKSDYTQLKDGLMQQLLTGKVRV